MLARRYPATIAISLALVSSLGAWVYSGVRAALVDLAAANLHSLAASEALAIETWADEKRRNVMRWAHDPRVTETAEQLNAAHRQGTAALRDACAGAPGARLVRVIDALRLEDNAASIHLIDGDGRVLATRDESNCAMQIAPALRRAFDSALRGQAQLAAPRYESERIGAASAGDGPRVWISAPVRNAAGEDDVVKVLDFGLVKETRSPHTRDLPRALRVLGTPADMAPERIEQPDSADSRSDLYALGAVGFFLLTGRTPFEGDSDLALAFRVVHTPAPRVSSVVAQAAPVALDELIACCPEKSTEDRPATAAEVAAALDGLLVSMPWTNQDARAWWEANGSTGQTP